VRRKLIAFLKDESAATAIEYGLIASGVALAIITAVKGIGAKLNTAFSSISTQLKLGRLKSILPAYALMKQSQQNDDRDWNAYQPEKDVAHVRLRLAGLHSAVFFPADDSPPRPITELPALDRG
jgi:pilus assembly protein Flp/PilA